MYSKATQTRWPIRCLSFAFVWHWPAPLAFHMLPVSQQSIFLQYGYGRRLFHLLNGQECVGNTSHMIIVPWFHDSSSERALRLGCTYGLPLHTQMHRGSVLKKWKEHKLFRFVISPVITGWEVELGRGIPSREVPWNISLCCGKTSVQKLRLFRNHPFRSIIHK